MQKRVVNRFLSFSIILALSLIFILTRAQTRKDKLNSKREKILKEIEYSTKLLNSTSDKKGETIQRLRIIDKKLTQRQQLIDLYKEQIKNITLQVKEKESRIKKLNIELDNQRRLYAEYIYYAYKNNNDYNTIVYLLASSTLDQFYLRKKYIDQLREARVKKVNLVKAITLRIDYEVKTLIDDKEEKKKSLKMLSREQRNLAEEKTDRERKVTELAQEEKALRLEIKQKKKVQGEIEKMIESIIREEAKKNSFSAMTPEQKLISDDFEKNRGRLPWPTRQGIITERFGKHRHPVIKSFETFNSGIDITTIQNEYVRAIFKGTVSKIFSIKGANYTVIVRHGSYYSVYHNLTEISVNVGDNLKTKDIIGKVSSRNKDNSSIVHLQPLKLLSK